ncbi:hypothetical protein LUZ60_016180 [Juncus effusus]|nr:hypothetical protein LUZ60_016180 [Juncus effusus]
MAEPSRELLDQPSKPSILETLMMCKEQKDVTKRELNKLFPVTSLPKSQVLGKIQNFLGEIAKANEKLELEVKEKPREEFDLEALTGNEKEYIEMDLLLGVADLNSEEAVARAEANVSNYQPIMSSNSSDSSSSEESEDEDEENEKYTVNSEDCVLKQAQEEKDESVQEEKPKKKQKKIVVLD